MRNASVAKTDSQKSEILSISLGCLKDKVENVFDIPEPNIMKILGKVGTKKHVKEFFVETHFQILSVKAMFFRSKFRNI